LRSSPATANSCDAVHLSRPDRDGQIRAMREALAESALAPEAIGYINAHGTATAVGDVVEAKPSTRCSAAWRRACPSARRNRCTAISWAAPARWSSPPRCYRSCTAGCRRRRFLEQPDPACRLRQRAAARRAHGRAARGDVEFVSPSAARTWCWWRSAPRPSSAL